MDAELVRRKLAKSRSEAQELIEAGHVRVDGATATKSATQVLTSAAVVVRELSEQRWVSRGAHKLIGALDHFGLHDLRGRVALDAGASTGGFTQVLLTRGVQTVMCVDVGEAQLDWSLRTDPRVVNVEKTNVRLLEPHMLPHRPDMVVADLSFISLGLVMPAIVRVSAAQADLLLMVKPQFEVGKAKVGANGVVRDPELRVAAVSGVAAQAVELGLDLLDVVASPLPGPKGNVEYFLWLRNDLPKSRSTDTLLPMNDRIRAAVEAGPQ